jgi:hypothetical protein
VQNDESSNNNNSKSKISHSNSNRRSTSRTPSNRRSTSMTPGDRRSTSKTRSKRRSTSRTPRSSRRRAEGCAGGEALSPRASATDNSLVEVTKATEMQGDAISCGTDSIAKALSKSPTKSTQKEHERHLTLPPVTKLHTVQNDESTNSNSSKSKISRSNSNRRSTSRTPSNRRSSSMTPGDRQSTSRTPRKQRSTSRTPSASRRRTEGSAGRSRSSGKDSDSIPIE